VFQGGSLWAGVVSGGISQVQDTTDLTKGKMDKKEYTVQTAENVTSAFGVMAGVEYGALLGTTVMPGIGTAVGAVIGGVLGDRVGRLVGHQTGNAIVNNRIMQNGVKSITQEDNV
jgi:outer membrane lipoprotein SlyB